MLTLDAHHLDQRHERVELCLNDPEEPAVFEDEAQRCLLLPRSIQWGHIDNQGSCVLHVILDNPNHQVCTTGKVHVWTQEAWEHHAFEKQWKEQCDRDVSRTLQEFWAQMTETQ